MDKYSITTQKEEEGDESMKNTAIAMITKIMTSK